VDKRPGIPILKRQSTLYHLNGAFIFRIALARAVYQNKEIYLIDDIFSAVDIPGWSLKILEKKFKFMKLLMYFSWCSHIQKVHLGIVKRKNQNLVHSPLKIFVCCKEGI
jgi:hypothetical protein